VIDDLNSNQSIDEGVRIKEEANKSADLCGIDWVMIGTAFETQMEVKSRIVAFVVVATSCAGGMTRPAC
jgi:hypothetical protein